MKRDQLGHSMSSQQIPEKQSLPHRCCSSFLKSFITFALLLNDPTSYDSQQSFARETASFSVYVKQSW